MKAATRAETQVAACASHGSESETESISATGYANAPYPRAPLTARVPYRSGESRLKPVITAVGAFFWLYAKEPLRKRVGKPLSADDWPSSS